MWPFKGEIPDLIGTEKPRVQESAPKRRKRNYLGNQVSSLLSDFLSPATSADTEIRAAIRRLRDRSRQLARNNPYAKRALQVYRTMIVGHEGLTFQSRARNLPLVNGRPDPNTAQGPLDQVGNARIERAWKEWSQLGNCEVSGKLSWVDVQQLVIESVQRDGEVLVKLVRDKSLPFGFGLQVLEGDYLDEQYDTTLANGNRIIMGVELNRFHRPVAYHLFVGPDHPLDYGTVGGYHHGMRRVRVPAEELLHIYLPERSQQTRGVPAFAAVMESMHQLQGYLQAEVVAARLGAAKMGFLQSPEGDGFDGEDTLDDYQPIMDASPGSIQQLPAGVNFQAWDPTHPTTAFKDFHSSVLRSIASGLGISYAELSNDLTDVNYSSIRQGAISERDHYRMLQNFLITHLAKPVHREWHKVQVLSGRFDWSMDKAEAKFISAAEFRGRGFAWVDPAKEINAAVDAVQSGFMSLSDVQLQYGRDPEEVFAQIQQDLEMAERYGLTVGHFAPLGPKQPFFLDLTNINQEDLANQVSAGNKRPGRPRNPETAESDE